MDTNVIIAIVVVVVIAALLAIGGWWFGKSRKSAVDKSTEVAKAKADARLATEKSAAQSAAASAENAEKTKETAESAATEAVESATSSAAPESPVATEPTPVGSAVTESATPAVETPEAAGTRMQRLKARLSKSGNPFGKPCSTSSPRISSPKPTGRTSKTPSCLPTWARKPANSSLRNCATTPASPANPTLPKCVRR